MSKIISMLLIVLFVWMSVTAFHEGQRQVDNEWDSRIELLQADTLNEVSK